MKNIFAALNYALVAIFSLEQAIPQGGMGKTKKEIILNGIQVAAKVGEGLGALNPIIGAVSAFIDGTVQRLNDSGIFGSKNDTPVSTDATPAVGSALQANV